MIKNARRQFGDRLVGHAVESMKERQRVHLLRDCVDDLAATVAHIYAPKAGSSVDQFPAAIVFNDDAMSAPDYGRAIPQQSGHRREWMQVVRAIELGSGSHFVPTRSAIADRRLAQVSGRCKPSAGCRACQARVSEPRENAPWTAVAISMASITARCGRTGNHGNSCAWLNDVSELGGAVDHQRPVRSACWTGHLPQNIFKMYLLRVTSQREGTSA
jgi:hypothetical protein